MPPLPKKKHSKKRKGGRTAHFGLTPITLSECPQCHSVKLPHRACPTCGYYNGREVVSTG
ncbi:MAG: 50S ribosomal protein L32 [Chloroflexi bacterium]|nr:50S ribosomal protein L32 [Chloroflexota bacterium]